jgi:hypothetical protein
MDEHSHLPGSDAHNHCEVADGECCHVAACPGTSLGFPPVLTPFSATPSLGVTGPPWPSRLGLRHPPPLKPPR